MAVKEAEKYVAVFDAEYTAKTNEYKGIQEMIQCALLITRFEDNQLCDPVETYKAFVKTTYNKSLSDFVVKLTGIKKENVESGQELAVVIDSLIDCLEKYDVQSIYIWGPDRKVLSYNLELIAYPKDKAMCLLNKMVDISEQLSSKLGSHKTLSQLKACKLCGVKPVGKNHNAPDDARNLVALINNNIEILN